MRLITLMSAAVILCSTGTAFGQGWAPYFSVEDGFSATFPGEVTTEEITYETEYRMTLPGRVHRSTDARGRYSTTVVDYRDILNMHNTAVEECRAANGANGRDGDSCQNDGRVEVLGAMDFAAWNYMKREGVKTTHFMWYFVEVVAGKLLHLDNPDGSRTYAVIHQHEGRLYIHEAVVNTGQPEPILFMQNLGFLNEAGESVRYRTMYTEGYGEWEFPNPTPPERRARDRQTLEF